LVAVALVCAAGAGGLAGQGARTGGGGSVRSVTIPVTLRLRREARQSEELRPVNLTLLEDGERQEILSTRSAGDRSPLYLAVLVQDDLVTSVANEIRGLADFIRRLPAGSFVLVGYMRSGSVQIRQKFTSDLERAANALRIPAGTPSSAPYNPYVTIREALKRFQGQPQGRRAALVVSDGLDASNGVSNSSPGQSIDLQRAISEAQRRGVAVHSIYAPTHSTDRNPSLVGNAQGALARLSDETGGQAFFQGTRAPVSFQPFLRQIEERLSRLIALTYLSTHPKKGFHRIKIETTAEDAELLYPAGHTR
jgi:VWFA-related protein